MKKLLFGFHGKVLANAERVQPLGLLLLRIAVGMVFIQTGWIKVHDVFTLTVQFRNWGIPFPELQAPFVAWLELTGGAAMLLGLGTRYVSGLLASTMVVAIKTAVWKYQDTETVAKSEFLDLFNFSEFTYIMIFAALAIFGAGAWSVDHIIKKKVYDPAVGKPS